MINLSKRTWLIIATIIAAMSTFYIWPAILRHPFSIFIELGGDSSKNYYTYLYHSLYDKPGFWFTGMNYPYGEHISYGDGQPFLSVPLSYIRNYIHLTPQLGLGILHLTVMFSFATGIVFTYRNLVYFKVAPLIAIIFSIFILLFSPQTFRSFGHFGLSYACVIPMLFYWSLKYNNTSRIRYLVYIFLLGSIAGLAHPYFAGMIFIWGFLYAIAYSIFTKNNYRQKAKHVLPFFIAVICVLISLKCIMHFTDPVKDRPTSPTGTLSACTTGGDIIASDYSTLWIKIKALAGYVDTHEGSEGQTYPGIVVIIAIMAFIAGSALRKIKKHSPYNILQMPTLWLFMAIAALLIGMGVPFVWGMDWLLDYISIFRQFRSLGRFSWIFYYIITVYGIVILYRYHLLLLSRNKNIYAYGIILGAIVLYSYEATGYKTYINYRCEKAQENYDMFFSTKEKNWPAFLKEHNIKSTDFQAILTLPYFHLGSEKLWQYYDAVAWPAVLTVKASLQLGLPTVDVNMSRTSWSQTFAQVRIQSGPLTDKPLLKVADNRPYLVLVRNTDSLTDPNQLYILSACSYIGTNADMKAYVCYPEALRQQDKAYSDNIMPMYSSINGDTCINCTGQSISIHFDNEKNTNTFFGTGAHAATKQEYDVLYHQSFHPGNDSLYEFSAWVLMSLKDYKSPYFDIEFYDVAEHLITKQTVYTYAATDNQGLWARASAFITVPANCAKLRCVIFDWNKNAYRTVDELQFRPVNALLIHKLKNGQALVNNHLFPVQQY